MATKRMLSSKIIDSDAFLDMPQTSQLLYFHLAMRVDDDGFVGSPKKVMRMIGSSNNDLDVLFGKKFILGFENGVIVIKHHRINNNWDSHNCKRTQYTEELGQLFIKENGSYTMDKTQGLLVQSEVRLISDGKKSLEENRIEEIRREENRIELQWLDQKSWEDWVNYKKEKKQKLTEATIKKQLAFLLKHKDNHVDIINQSITNGWTGLFELRNNNKSKKLYVSN